MPDQKPAPAPDVPPKREGRIVYIAAAILFLIAGINLVGGIAAEVYQVPLLRHLEYGWLSLALGVTFLTLGFLALWRRSALAFWFAAALFLLDGVWEVSRAAAPEKGIMLGGLAVRLLLTMPMLLSIPILRRESAPRQS